MEFLLFYEPFGLDMLQKSYTSFMQFLADTIQGIQYLEITKKPKTFVIGT